jgi:hypothetical protein
MTPDPDIWHAAAMLIQRHDGGRAARRPLLTKGHHHIYRAKLGFRSKLEVARSFPF